MTQLCFDFDAVIRIPLYNRQGNIVTYSLIDSQDAEVVLPYTWKYLKAGKGYAVRSVGTRSKGTREIILLHREIMGLPRKKNGIEVDHKNRDGLDNRRENLRVLTHAQNRQNTSSHRGSSSLYRGVYWDRHDLRWIARVRHNGINIFRQSFLSELEAHEAVVNARLVLFPYTIED
jgi:hypothetical protein